MLIDDWAAIPLAVWTPVRDQAVRIALLEERIAAVDERVK